MAKSRYSVKRILSRALKVGILASVLLGLATLVLCAWYVSNLGEIVAAKFEGRKWKLPSKIYADSKIFYPGLQTGLEEIEAQLQSRGYRLTDEPLHQKGEYRLDKRRGVIEVYVKDFHYPLGDFEGFPVRFTVNRGRVEKLARLDTRKNLASLELEPQIVTGFYDRVWEERKIVRLAEVPPLVTRAILAVEDERFYLHRGVDPVAVVRAFFVNLKSGGVVQGGSTLTQQLMKNFFLDSERTLERKVKEALMALVAEYRYSKEEILENYLNEIYLGQNGAQGIFGVWEAARFYFSKEPTQLSVAETALLAGLIKAPNRYSPYRDVEEAMRRRDVVLGKMLEAELITRREYDIARARVLEPRKPSRVRNDAPYFTDFLKRELEENYSHDALTAEGLSIFTSLDLDLQRLAEQVLQEGLTRLENRYRHIRRKAKKDNLQGVIVAIKPQTGEIKAMVGGRNYQKSQFNRAAQAKRQPGSVFKPFVYLAALLQGYRPTGDPYTAASVIEDRPFTWTYEGQDWKPENYKNKYFGRVSVRQALERSLNAATARVAQDVGIKKVREMAYRLGIQSPLPLLPSLTLGAVEVTPLEVARAFSTLANNGVRTNLLSIKHVIDQEGRGLEKRNIRVRKVISPQAAYLMNHLLRGVVDRGTGRGVRRLGFKRPAAGKTGTTNDARDAWFVGYTPDLLAVVWVGFDRQTKLGLTGAQAALPIWTDFMKHASVNTPPTEFVKPPGLVVLEIDPSTGYLATPRCPERVRELFMPAKAPQDFCPLHPDSFHERASPGFYLTGDPRDHPAQ